MATLSNQTDLLEKYTVLCNAIKERDKDAIRRLLLNNVPVNPPKQRTSIPARCPNSNVSNNRIKKFSYNTPLHWAVLQFDDSEVLDMLLAKGADISLKDFRQKTPLQIAVELNKRCMIKSLLNNGAHVGADLPALIIHSIEAEHKSTVKLLVGHELKTKGSINLEKAIDCAAEKGNIQLLQFFFTFENCLGTTKFIPTNLILKNGSKSENCLQFLLQKGYLLNLRDKKNFSLAYKAVTKRCTVVVDRFLKLGINVNKMNYQTGLTFLHLACINNDIEMVKLLINYKPDMKLTVFHGHTKNAVNLIAKDIKYFGKTALYIAVENLNIPIIKLLHANGASINNDPDLLNLAIEKNSAEVILFLLELGINVNGSDNLGVTPARYIISGNLCTNMQALRKKNTPLHNAVLLGLEDIVKILLKYKANVMLTDSTNRNPLQIAIDNENMSMIDIFLNHGVNPNISNGEGITLLHYACIKSKKIMVEKLLKHNASVLSVSVNGETPLHQACRHWDFEIIQILLNYSPNVNAKNKRNKTPFHVLSEQDFSYRLFRNNFMINKFTEICDSFKRLNANFNAKDSKERTPLFHACSKGNLELVRILLEYHVKVNTLDNNGRTPLHVAALIKNRGFEIIKLLLEKNAIGNVVDKNGKTILHNAATQDNLNIVELLYTQKININAKDKNGDTALHIATRNGYKLLIYNLLKNGADATIFNNNNKSVFDIALKNIESAENEAEEYQMYHSNSDDWHEYESDEYEFYQNHVEDHQSIMKLFKNHITKLKTAGFCIDSQITKFINPNLGNMQNIGVNVEYILSYEKNCEQEIEKLKVEKIGHITLYDILTKSINSIAKFSRHSNLIEALKSYYYDKIFPLYIDIIRYRFKEGTMRAKLLEIIQTCDLPDIFTGLPSLCFHEICSYLDNEDLKTFVSVLKIS